jgi:RyR domain
MDATRELPRYKSHKTVQALKIARIETFSHSYGVTLHPADEGYTPFQVSSEFVAKHQPQPGGYFVRYDDGYTSYSPAKAFEEGYTRTVMSESDKQRARIDRIAQVCHEVNRAYCQALGDNSQPAWADAPAWQHESARMGVDLHLSGDFGPEASHISWMKQKVDEGWVYGPEKNPELKTHHCIVPFDQLPREQQAKDFIFRAVVHALRG